MRKGFTIIEILIATSIFTLAAVVASRILVDIVQVEKRTAIENAVYEDARIAMEQIVTVIQNSAIDYEEYYSQLVIQAAEVDKVYGINYGVYGSRFFSPGHDGGGNPNELGVKCSQYDGNECILIQSDTTDLNVGRNPYFVADSSIANAFCDDVNCPPEQQSEEQDELYLINNLGNEKVIMARQATEGADEWALAVVIMEGSDLDQNGFMDVFSCYPEFNCSVEGIDLLNYISYPFFEEVATGPNGGEFLSGISIPKNLDLQTAYNLENPSLSAFIPITPLRVNVTDLSFTITPVEDPYRAFDETETTLAHPTVTVRMTLDLTEETKKLYPGEFEPLSLQTTVAAGVIGAVHSYPPVDDVQDPSDPNDYSWISDVLPNTANTN